MKTTVIIPAYNAEKFIAEALDSVFQQTRLPDEVIVVDDCSTDATRDVAARFPVRILSTTANSGHAAARNVGIAAATGDVIAWLDADDYFEPRHLEIVCGLLDRYPEASIAFSGVRLFGERSGGWTGFPCSGGPTSVFRNCLRSTVVPAMSAVTRTEPLRNAGGFDATIRVAPDFDLWLRMSRSCLFVSTDEMTSNYRWHSSQISSNPHRQIESMYRARWKVYRQVCEGPRAEFDLSPEMMAAEMRKVWESDLQDAWYRRNLKLLRTYSALGRFIPGKSSAAWQMKLRSRIPASAVKTWDSLRRILKCHWLPTSAR